MPSTSASVENSVWLKKRLDKWKNRSSEHEAMRKKANEKLVSKGLAKGKYRFVEAAKQELLDAVRVYRGLSPQVEKFVFDNGDEKQLVNVNGTIPVEYKGSNYNIPVCFWLLPDFPAKAPMSFVTPTKDMQLKVSNHVDYTGKVFLTYLDEWKYPESNLLGLIQGCREAFGILPPVFAKAKSPSSSNSTPSSATSTPHHNPGQQAQVQDQTTVFRRSFLAEEVLSNEERGGEASSSSNNGRTPNNLIDLDTEPDPPVVEDALTVEFQRVALVTQAEDVIRERFGEEFGKTRAELQTLHSTNKELLDGQEEIGAIEAELDAKLDEMACYVEDLQKEHDGLVEHEAALDDLDPEALDVDKGIINPQDPVHSQLVRAFAEDAAISDAIYHLGEGLRQGLFPNFDVYMKKVRNLSRQQFYLRATMIKCRQKAGLDDLSP